MGPLQSCLATIDACGLVLSELGVMSKLIALRPAPAQTRPPRRCASSAPRPLARGRCPSPLHAERRADASAAWATAMRPGAVEGAMGQTSSCRPGRCAPRPGRPLPIANFDGRLRSSGAPGRSIIGQRGCARLSAEAQRRPCALTRHAHRPLAHRASGLGRADARRLPKPDGSRAPGKRRHVLLRFRLALVVARGPVWGLRRGSRSQV